MKAEPKRRRWLYAVPAAGSVVLLAVLLDPFPGRVEPAGATLRSVIDRVAAQARVQHAFHHSRTPTRVASNGAMDRSARLHEELGHLSDLDRTPEEDELLWIAEEELVTTCMRKRGFTYLPSLPDDVSVPDDDSAPNDNESESDMKPSRANREAVDTARSVGYALFKNIQEGETPNIVVDQNAERLSRMNVEERGAFLEALRGPALSPADLSMRHKVESVPLPGGGAAYWYRDSCFAQARRQLYGEDYEYNELGYSHATLREELHTQIEKDPAYKDSLDAWRSCMHTRGFNEERPAAAAGRLANEYQEGKLSLDELHGQELLIATADAECYLQADIEHARQTAELRAEKNLFAQNREKLMAMKRSRDKALEHAESILATADP